MVGALALYEEWWAYLLAIGFVVLQHGLMGGDALATPCSTTPTTPGAGPASTASSSSALVIAELVSWRASERGRAKTASSEERFRRAFDDAPVAMALVSPRGRVLQGNRELRERTGHEQPRGPVVLGLRPGRGPLRRCTRELAAARRHARDRAPLRARRRHHRLDPVAPLADPRRRRPPGPLHLPGRRHHRPQARRRAARPPGPPRSADRTCRTARCSTACWPRRSSASPSSAARSRSCSPTSTTSRSSTTRSAIAPATSCWWPSPSASPTELRPDDVIARFGGDEFVILLERVEDLDDVRGVADRLAARDPRAVRARRPASASSAPASASRWPTATRSAPRT